MSEGSTKRTSVAGPVIAAVLLILPLLYVASYFANVNPPGRLLLWSGHVDRYRWGGRRAETFYWPLEQLDRKLRPGKWEQPLIY